jgi:hypothetical protein
MTTTQAQIGRAIASILSNLDKTANKYLLITSWVTTQNKVLEACKSVTKSTWQVNHVPSTQRHEEGVEMLAKGQFLGIGRLWNVWCHSDGKGHAMKEEELSNEMLQLPVENMETVIKEILA